MLKYTCDNCGAVQEFYSTFRTARFSCTLCDDCVKIIPTGYFSGGWDGTYSNEFLMLILKVN